MMSQFKIPVSFLSIFMMIRSIPQGDRFVGSCPGRDVLKRVLVRRDVLPSATRLQLADCTIARRVLWIVCHLVTSLATGELVHDDAREKTLMQDAMQETQSKAKHGGGTLHKTSGQKSRNVPNSASSGLAA